MRSALSAIALVGACALAVLALDRPAAAEPGRAGDGGSPRAECCAFPDVDYRDPAGWRVRLPIRWEARAHPNGAGIVVDGDQGEQLWIAPLPDGVASTSTRAVEILDHVMRLAAPGRRYALRALTPDAIRAVVLDGDENWITVVLAPRADGRGAALHLFRARREHVASLARRFDTVLASARDARGDAIAAALRFDTLSR